MCGKITPEQIKIIIGSLDEGEYFIPGAVGLPERRFENYDPEVDHPFFELWEDGFTDTEECETVDLEVAELVSAFCAAKGRWIAAAQERGVSYV